MQTCTIGWVLRKQSIPTQTTLVISGMFAVEFWLYTLKVESK